MRARRGGRPAAARAWLPALGLALAALAAGGACTLRSSGGKGGSLRPDNLVPRPAVGPTPLPGPGPEPAPPPVPQPPPRPRIDESSLDTAGNVVDYARFCKQELGIPDAVQEPWSCLDGKEIPVTVNGTAPSDAVYRDLAAGRVGCDHPSWLGDVPCANYAFVQRRALAPNVEAWLLCRVRGFSSPKDRAARRADYERTGRDQDFRTYYEFDSVGLIWTNVRTGRTCFFDFAAKTYGGRVVSPDSPTPPTWDELPAPKPPQHMAPGSGGEAYWRKDGRAAWRAPRDVVESDNCVRCHDTGAFKSSPWIEQAQTVPVNDPRTPYVVVGKVFDPWRTRFPVRAISTTPITMPGGASEEQVCTACHRIGSLFTCEVGVDYAVGHKAPIRPSPYGVGFFVRTWMPPMPEEWKGRSESEAQSLWDARYDRHLRKMRCCCADPRARGCLSQDITRDPMPGAVEGAGPNSCE